MNLENLNLSWTELTPEKAQKLSSPFAPLMEKMQLIKDKHKRVLVINKDLYLPQSVVVVYVDKVYERFALCHSTDKATGECLNYTINYGEILDSKSGIRIVVEQ